MKLKALLITLVFAVIGFLLNGHTPIGAAIWPPLTTIPQPTGIQMPLFMLLTIIEALLFGLGFAFLILGWPMIEKLATNKNQAILAYLSVGWLLISWVPHDNLHMHAGLQLNQLLAIEYGFHVTLMLAGLLIAIFFLNQVKQNKTTFK